MWVEQDIDGLMSLQAFQRLAELCFIQLPSLASGVETKLVSWKQSYCPEKSKLGKSTFSPFVQDQILVHRPLIYAQNICSL